MARVGSVLNKLSRIRPITMGCGTSMFSQVMYTMVMRMHNLQVLLPMLSYDAGQAHLVSKAARHSFTSLTSFQDSLLPSCTPQWEINEGYRIELGSRNPSQLTTQLTWTVNIAISQPCRRLQWPLYPPGSCHWRLLVLLTIPSAFHTLYTSSTNKFP